MTDVSISIVNWNAEELLKNCLRSLFEHESGVSLEIIVVDNGSTDGSLSMVRSEFPFVKLVVNDENLGFASANNQAFEVASGRYLLLLNNDTVVLPGALDTMVEFMDGHPEAGMLGCKLRNPDGSLQASCRTFPTLATMLFRSIYLDKLFPQNRWSGASQMSYWDYGNVREVDVIIGCCMLVRREVLEDVGPMDEKFFMCSEDTDWCYRAKHREWKIYFTPEAEIIHLGGQSRSRQPARMAIDYYHGNLRFFRKHHGWLAYMIARLLAIIGTAMRLLFWTSSRLIWRRKRAQATQKIAAYWPTLRWLSTAQVDEIS